jgi:ABC-type nitrate/sulfonate/bicarbonate transport system permease component
VRFKERFQDYQRPILGLISVVSFFLLWEFLLTYVITLNPFFLSKPSLIASSADRLITSGELWKNLYVSGRAFLFGFIAAVLVGIPIGVIMGWRRRVAYALDPLLTAFYAAPLVALAPLLIIVFGVGITAKAFLIFLLAIFPFIFNAYAGVQSVEPLFINVVRSLGGKDRHLISKVILPSILPYLVAGTRIAIGRAIVGIIVGEFYAASEGIGYAIQFYGDNYLLSEMFVCIFLLMIVAVAFTEGLRKAELAIAPWRAGQEVR